VKILSGTFPDANGQDVTTGTPIALLIENVDQRSKDYSEIKDTYRPGHADYTYDVKYGLRDYAAADASRRAKPRRGSRPGAIARRIMPRMTVRGALIQIGPHRIDRAALGLGPGCREPVLLPRRRQRRDIHRLPRRRAQAGLLGRRRGRGRGRERAARASARRSTASSTPSSPAR
jgi:chorismate synthase